MNKRSLFEIEIMALELGLCGRPVDDKATCKIICNDLTDAYYNTDVLKLHELLSLYVFEFRLFNLSSRTYHDNTGVLVKYDPKKNNLHFTLEDGKVHNIRIDTVNDLLPFFEVFKVKDVDNFFTTCGIYTNDWYEES